MLEMAYGNAASVEIHKKRGFPRAAWKSPDKKRRDFSTFPQALLDFFAAFRKRKKLPACAVNLPSSQICRVDRKSKKSGGVPLWTPGRSSILERPGGRFFQDRSSTGSNGRPSETIPLARVIFCLPKYCCTPQALHRQDKRLPFGICLYCWIEAQLPNQRRAL